MRKAFLSLASSICMTGVAWAGGEVHGGTYISDGTNLDGSHYHGTATIKIISDTTCQIAWQSGESNSPTSRGICMRDSARFTAAYKMGNAIGLAIYKIGSDGTLNGIWTIAGESGAGTETLTPE